MTKSSDIIKIGFDYRASLEQFVKETNGVFDGISEKAGKQRISIQLDAKDDKVIEKIKELQKLKLDKFTFEFGESGLSEQLKTFDKLEKKITEIINLSKGINNIGLGNGIGNSIVDEKSLNSIIDLFGKMENHLGEIKRVFADVGDGEEFSPLLKMINNVQSSISELTTSVKGIGLNMNIDVGSDSEMETKVQSKIANALQAYQRLFDHIKMSSAGGQIITDKFFDFDINQYDTMMGKLQAYKKFIDNMRKEAKSQFNGQDVLYQDTEKSYWTQASAAMGQVTRAFNEINASSDTNPLKDLFGSGDLSEVISQLGLIVTKLEEISTTASSFKSVFDNGFNITNSVEEIDKLTNRVKELEDELSKVKLNPVNVDKSNLSSENFTNQIVENEKKKQEAYKATADTVMYHAGVISKLNKAETNGRFYGSDRGSGYFGTGHYFVDSVTKHELDNSSSYSKLPYTSIDISQYDNLFKATTNEIADGLHAFLKNLTKFTQGRDTYSVSELFSQFQKVFGETVMDMQEFDAKLENLKTYMQNSNMDDRGDSVSTQFMKSLGYGGVDTRGTKYADTRYGTVIYDLKEESILQANITDELQKQGQMLEKINYEKGQVFDKSEDTRIQSILDQQAKSKEIDAEFNKLYDSTQLKAYESELDSVNNKLKENDNIISECSFAIANADEDAKQFAKEMKALGIEMSQEEIANTVNQNRESYQTRIDELEKERPLLEARKQELEQNLQTEYELANATRERAKAIVEERNKPIEDVFQGGTASAEKLEEEIKNIDSATEKASESAKEYRKILSQVGEFDIDSKVSAMYKRNDGQLESWTWRAKKDDEGNILYDQNGKIDYGDPTITVISKYEQLEKIIVKADNELRNLQKDLSEIKAYDPTASTTNIEAKISDQKEYIRLLEQTVKVISQSDDYLLDEQQIIEARNKAAREYALTTGAKQEKTDAKQSASDEKKRLANIEQVNRALNKQQITIDAIEKTYNKTTNPDLDREVSNQQDLAELAQKKLDIQTKIDSLQDQERNSANEKEFLELEKLIAEYKELAKYKLKANNPSKQELGGQNLQTLIQEQIYKYDRLITKAEKYGDATSETVEKLKEQKDILSKMGSDGKYSATADQYYASRDAYKVESAALSAFEAETRAIKQKKQAVKELSDELKSYNNQIPKKPVDGKRSDYFEGFVQNYKKAIKEAQKYLDNLGDSPVTEEVKNKWGKLIEVIEQAKKEMDAVPNADRGSDANSRMKEIDKLTKYLDKNTRISKEAREQLEEYLALLKSGDPSVNVKEIHTAWTKVAVAEREAGREGKSFLDIFKNKVVYNYAAQLAGYFLSFMDIIRYTREGIDTLKEFDDGLTKISYTMDMTKSQLDNLGKSILDTAKDINSSIDNTMQVSQIYANMNTSAEEIKKLSEPTLILSNLTGFDASTVADDIQAVTQQFEIASEESMHIADVYDQISRNISVDYSKGIESIAEAVQVSGSTAKQAGLSFEQLAAIVGKTAEKTRLEGSQIGNGLKTIMTRLSKVGELSDEVDPETLSDASESLHKIGIEVYNADGSFRKFDVIMGELANKWDTLSDAEKSNISFSIAA